MLFAGTLKIRERKVEFGIQISILSRKSSGTNFGEDIWQLSFSVEQNAG
jgi:hypothetical protein